MRKVYLDIAWTMHSQVREWLPFPPQGYQFVISPAFIGVAAQAVYKRRLLYLLSQQVSEILPLTLIKAYLDKIIEKPPSDAALTLTCLHLNFRKEPWVLWLDYAATPIGLPKHFLAFKRIVQKCLASQYCRAVLCPHEASRKSVLFNFDCSEFEHKIEVVYPAVRPKNFKKTYVNDRVKILFVGSANFPNEFEVKGGREVFEVFRILREKYDNVELVIRAGGVPEMLKKEAAWMGKVRMIESVVDWEVLENELRTADIFLFPCHWTPWQAMLDAASYELPIVTIDAYANPEIVQDDKTGFVVKKSEKISYYIESFLPSVDTPQFHKSIRTLDFRVVRDLAEKTSTLIENAELRRNMGRAGRWEIEHGRFSFKARNAKLEKIFDQAINTDIL